MFIIRLSLCLRFRRHFISLNLLVLVESVSPPLGLLVKSTPLPLGQVVSTPLPLGLVKSAPPPLGQVESALVRDSVLLTAPMLLARRLVHRSSSLAGKVRSAAPLNLARNDDLLMFKASEWEERGLK